MTIQKKNSGFTLVEILVAIAIFGIVVSTLYASFHTVIASINPMNQGLDDYEMAQNAMDRIRKDLYGLYLLSDSIYSPPGILDDDDADRFRFVSQRNTFSANSYSRLRFASFGHLDLNRDQNFGIGIIQYYVEPSENGEMLLKRSDIGLVYYNEDRENDFLNDPVLCERIKAFELEFMDTQGETHAFWDSDASDFGFTFPFSIHIKLVIGDDNTTRVFATTIVLPVQREKIES